MRAKYQTMNESPSGCLWIALGVIGVIVSLGVIGVAVAGLTKAHKNMIRLNDISKRLTQITDPTQLDLDILRASVISPSTETGTLEFQVPENTSIILPPSVACTRTRDTPLSDTSNPASPITIDWESNTIDDANICSVNTTQSLQVNTDGRYLVGAYINFDNVGASTMGIVLRIESDDQEICGHEIADPASVTSTLPNTRIQCNCYVHLTQGNIIKTTITAIPTAGGPHPLTITTKSTQWLIKL